MVGVAARAPTGWTGGRVLGPGRLAAGIFVLSFATACTGQQVAAERTTTEPSPATTTATTRTPAPAAAAPTIGDQDPATFVRPTPTPTPPPAVPVVGWEGEGVRVVSVEVAFNYPERTAELEAMVSLALGQIGLDFSDHGDAAVRVELEGTPLSAQYIDTGQCHNGARIHGTVRLTAEGMPDVEAPVEGSVPTPFLINECEKDPAGAPFEDAFEMGFSGAMAALFGPASVPYLTEVLAFPRSGYWSVILPIQAAAIDAYRTLDHDAIPVASQHAFLEQVLWSLAGVVGTPDPEGDKYVRTVRGLLLEYSETDFGFATDDDLESWRQWLADWGPEHGL